MYVRRRENIRRPKRERPPEPPELQVSRFFNRMRNPGLAEGLDLEDDAGIEFARYPVGMVFRLRGGIFSPEHGQRVVYTLAFALAEGLKF